MSTATADALPSTRKKPARIFSFPNPVNEVAARVVAGGVLLSSAVILGLSLGVDHRWLWATLLIAYGFLARVAAGPTLSPLGQFASRIAAPRIGHTKLVAGPPKRFAQAVGAVVTVSASLLVVLGQYGGAQVLLAGMILAAGLESIFAFCLGCKAFAGLMAIGLIPPETCEACANVALRLGH
jgi:hypothetical protein